MDAPPTGDPRVHARPITRHGMTFLPLTARPGGIQAFTIVLPGTAAVSSARQQVHAGHDWMYVLSGRVRLLLGDQDLVLTPGEVAEFDTRVPHWFGAAGEEPAELLSLLGPQGERMHVRAGPRPRRDGRP